MDKQRLTVALLGNMNNNHFALGRYLRRLGIDCVLFLFNDDYDHFHPRCDAFDLDYMSWVRELSWGSPLSFAKTRVEEIRGALGNFDVIIGCGLAPAFLYRIGRALDIMVPYGGDIWTRTYYSLVAPHNMYSVWRSVSSQKAGLNETKVVHMNYTNPMYEERCIQLMRNAIRWDVGMPMVYEPAYSIESLSVNAIRTHWYHEFMTLRERNEFVVIAHGRHSWGDDKYPGAKGVDRLLSGWALFCKATPKVRKKLILMEYGEHIDKSRAYIETLDISMHIAWMPKMFRKDIMPCLMHADMVAGEFQHSWMSSGVLYEALVAGKPIVAYRDDKLYESHYSDLYPIFNAREPTEICRAFLAGLNEPLIGRNMGIAGQTWYRTKVVDSALKLYVDYLSERASEIGRNLFN